MDPDQKSIIPNPTRTNFRWACRRKIHLRKRKLPTARLGGKKPGRGLFLVRLFRRARLRWLKLKYSCLVKKLKQYYRSLVRDLLEGSATMESIQQRVLLETSFAIPAMGMSFAFPNSYEVDRS